MRVLAVSTKAARVPRAVGRLRPAVGLSIAHVLRHSRPYSKQSDAELLDKYDVFNMSRALRFVRWGAPDFSKLHFWLLAVKINSLNHCCLIILQYIAGVYTEQPRLTRVSSELSMHCSGCDHPAYSCSRDS